MSTTRDVSTRLILQGEKEYRAAMQQISREYRVLESELKKVDSDFEGQRNTLAALEARHKALNDVIAQQSQRLKTEKDALENARKLQEDYARQAAAARQSLDELISSTDDAAKETEEYKDEVARLQSEITKNEAAETKCAQAVANHTVKANDAQVKLNALNRELASNGKYLDEAKNSADGCERGRCDLGGGSLVSVSQDGANAALLLENGQVCTAVLLDKDLNVQYSGNVPAANQILRRGQNFYLLTDSGVECFAADGVYQWGQELSVRPQALIAGKQLLVLCGNTVQQIAPPEQTASSAR